MKASLLPVCGAKSGGTRHIVIDGVNGLLFEPGNSASLAAALVRLEADETLRETLARGAAQTGATYSTERFRQEFRPLIFQDTRCRSIPR